MRRRAPWLGARERRTPAVRRVGAPPRPVQPATTQLQQQSRRAMISMRAPARAQRVQCARRERERHQRGSGGRLRRHDFQLHLRAPL